MRKRHKLPPAAYLRECFAYEPKTGVLRWKKRPYKHFAKRWVARSWNTRFAGTIAGYKDNYWHVRLDSIGYWQHRVIWKIVTSKEPPSTVDHKDLNGLNNRWKNLRPASQQEQNRNRTWTKSRNASGYRGVDWHQSRWRACIKLNYVQTHLGYFDTAKKASLAYETTARKIHDQFYRQAA